MKTLYALLTGICRYHPQSKNVPPLKGCENDVNAWKAFLEKNYGTAYKLEIKTLLNDQATWQNVVEHLGDKHLGKADQDDVALFYYSGHGSRQRSAPEFLPFFPDGWDETLVLHDSRAPGGKDLADKELAVLLHQLGQKTQNLVVLLDCCHSGSGTRAAEPEIAAKKQSPDSTTPRDFNSYLFGWYARNFPGGQNISLPTSRHILLAACDRKEVAYELKNDRGLFSYSLINDLEKNGVNVSYAQLFTRCRHAMLRIFKNQHPQFEPVQYFNAHELFLAPGGAAKPTFLASHLKEKSVWEINCGALQGLPTDPDKQAKFAIYEKGEKKGHANAVRTRLQKCEVQLDFAADTSKQYQAELISLPAAKMPVKLVRTGQGTGGSGSSDDISSPSSAGGGADGRGVVQPTNTGRNVTRTATRSAVVTQPIFASRTAATTRSGGTTTGSNPVTGVFKVPDYQPVHFELVADDIKTDYVLELSPNKIRLLRQTDGKVLRTIEGDLEDQCWKDAFDFLEHVARWEKSKALDNRNSRLDRTKLRLLLTDKDTGKDFSAEAVELSMKKSNDGYEKKPFRMSVENQTGRDLECGLFYFANDFAVHSLNTERLASGNKAVFFDDFFELTGGETASSEELKLFASTEPLDSFMLTIDGLRIGESASYWRSRTTRGGLDLRPGAKDQAYNAATAEDWFAVSMTVHLKA